VAEAQVTKLANGDVTGKSTVVSVKSTVAASKKRQREDDAKEKEKEKKAGARRNIKKAKR
jgi:hypothetical protein